MSAGAHVCKEDAVFPVAGVAGGYESPDMGAVT